MTNSKEDSELEEILKETVQFTHENGNKIVIEPTEAVRAINSKFITKEESDRRVLEARIEELEMLTYRFDSHHENGVLVAGPSKKKSLKERIAELRELLNGDTP